MLHNLCRGTGLRGLCTMRPVDGEIIRPILCLNRDKIAEYLKEKKISHIQDSTNLSDEYYQKPNQTSYSSYVGTAGQWKGSGTYGRDCGKDFQAEEYLTQQSCRVLASFRKVRNITLLKNFL